MEVQEYLDALVDEIHISDDESEHPLSESRVPEIVVAPPLDSNTQLPKMSRFSTDMEQYLFGYGEDYGQLSSANIIVEEPQSKNNLDKTEDTNSIEVLTSLGSTHSHPHDDTDDITLDVHLPTEEESVSEQVKRFQSSMEQENITNHVMCNEHLCTVFYLSCLCRNQRNGLIDFSRKEHESNVNYNLITVLPRDVVL